MKSARSAKEDVALPRVAPRLLRVFSAYTHHYLRGRFHTIRILKKGLPQLDPARPIVVFLNHASWWDPLVCLLLARQFLADRSSFAPIEAAMLERYRFFRRLGFFGVEPSGRGALKFLRIARALLASPRHALWLTPQGRFSDVRARPLRLQRGLAALAVRTENVTFLPLALEYTFWHDSRPEILVSFGAPIIPDNKTVGDVPEWTQKFSAALAATQDELALRACQRDPSEWLLLNEGSSSVNVFYDCWRWLRARLGGQEFTREHPVEVMR